jgi:hypothetical protein
MHYNERELVPCIRAVRVGQLQGGARAGLDFRETDFGDWFVSFDSATVRQHFSV